MTRADPPGPTPSRRHLTVGLAVGLVVVLLAAAGLAARSWFPQTVAGRAAAADVMSHPAGPLDQKATGESVNRTEWFWDGKVPHPAPTAETPPQPPAPSWPAERIAPTEQ